MWMAEFVLCTIMQGCIGITFNDQREFATKNECETYTEQKSDLVVEKMSEFGEIGKIYYDCKFKGSGLKT